MFAEKPTAAVPPLRLHSQLSEALAHARTPLDLLSALAREGTAHALDLWGLAMPWEGETTVSLATVPPLPPGSVGGSVEQFASKANALAQRAGCRDFVDAEARVLCLGPALPPMPVGLAEYREVAVPLAGGELAVLRAGCLQVSALRVPAWGKMVSMVEAVTPYLRGLKVGGASTHQSILDAESGAYSWPYFLDALEREVERARRQLSEVSLAVLELRPQPGSGPLDQESHYRVGTHLAEVVRRTDMVGRTGPTSYAIFFHNTGPRPALIAAGRIAEALRADRDVMSSLTFSLGVSGWECDGVLCVSTLLAQAGEAAAEAAVIAPDRAFVYL